MDDFKDKSKPLPGTDPSGLTQGWEPTQFDQQVSCDNRLTSKLEQRETDAYERAEQMTADRLDMPLYLVAEMGLAGTPKYDKSQVVGAQRTVKRTDED